MTIFYGSLKNYSVSARKKKKRKIVRARKSPAPFIPLTTSPKTHVDTRIQQLKQYPSWDGDTAGSAPRVEPQQYTGTYIKGIATMHKSNAIPITNDDQARDVARMRR
jgi:hypothetical protein